MIAPIDDLARLVARWDERDERYRHLRVRPSPAGVEAARLARAREARAALTGRELERALHIVDAWMP